MKEFIEYSGMSYEQASREAMRLIRAASESQMWTGLPDRLICLRRILWDQTWKNARATIDGTGWAEAAFEPMTNEELYRWARREGGPIVDYQY